METEKSALQLTNKIRKLADAYLEKHQMGSALFWSGQAMHLSGGAPDDTMRLAECLIVEKQYHRASHLLKKQNLESTKIRGCYLAAKAAYESNELEEAVSIMERAHDLIEGERQNLPEHVNNFTNGTHTDRKDKTSPLTTSTTPYTKQRSAKKQNSTLLAADTTALVHEGDAKECIRQTLGAIFLLRGRIMESLDNRPLAAEAFQEAVRTDVFCHEAFEALIKHQILTAEEERRLLDSMPFDEQCEGDEEKALIRFLHQMKLKKYDKPADLLVPKMLEPQLTDNSDLLVAKAERHFYNCDYTQCFNLTSAIMKNDPFHTECLPIHISCLVELRNSNGLFHLGIIQ